jgi:hypothetical protein
MCRTLVRQIATGRYDLVHVRGVNQFLHPMALAAAQRSGVADRGLGRRDPSRRWPPSKPVVTPAVCGRWSGGRSGKPCALLRRTKGLVAVCHFEVETFARRLGFQPERIRLIRNGAKPLAAGDSVPGVTGSPRGVLSASTRAVQGAPSLIAAMPALLHLAPGAHLAVIGRGSFEPLALGGKVVVADTSGLSELASEGFATAVPPNASPRELAGVLARVAARPDPRPPDLPAWDDCADQLLALYKEIVPTGPKTTGLRERRRGGERPAVSPSKRIVRPLCKQPHRGCSLTSRTPLPTRSACSGRPGSGLAPEPSSKGGAHDFARPAPRDARPQSEPFGADIVVP